MADDSTKEKRYDGYDTSSLLRRYHSEEIQEIKRNKAENVRVDAIETIAKEAKQLAQEAVGKASAHVCQQLVRINEMQDTLKGWTKWARGAFLSAIALLITIGITAFSWFDTLGDKRRASDAKVDQLRITLEQVRENQSEIKTTLKQEYTQPRKDHDLRKLTALMEKMIETQQRNDRTQ